MSINFTVLIPVLLLTTVCIHASEEREDVRANLAFSLDASAEFTDNALKEYTDIVDERHDTIVLDVEGGWQNRYLAIDADYKFTKRSFSEGTEPDDSTIDGQASIDIAKGKPIYMNLFHSRRQVLNDPSNAPLFTNFEERDILRAELGLVFPFGSVDTLSIVPYASKVKLEKAKELDNERLGGDLKWSRRLSTTDQFVVELTGYGSSFDDGSRDYDLARWSFGYQATLRRLEYNINAGINKISPSIGRETEAPFYNASIEYSGPLQEFSVNGSRLLTDSSRGNDNQQNSSPFNIRSGSEGNVDQMELTTYSLDYTAYWFCSRCSLDVFLSVEDEAYISLEEQDNQRRRQFLRGSYKLAAKTTFQVSGGILKSEFKNNPLNNYEETKVEIKLIYRPSVHWSISFFGAKEDRDATNNVQRGYSEQVVGLSVRYSS